MDAKRKIRILRFHNHYEIITPCTYLFLKINQKQNIQIKVIQNQHQQFIYEIPIRGHDIEYQYQKALKNIDDRKFIFDS